MSDQNIQFSQKSYNDLCILTIHERSLDTDKAPVFKTELLRLIAGGAKHLLINMSEVDTIDNSGMGALTFGKRQLDDMGGQVFSLLPAGKCFFVSSYCQFGEGVSYI